jgi:drug/metabolite transporter (DMT)-like permease
MSAATPGTPGAPPSSSPVDTRSAGAAIDAAARQGAGGSLAPSTILLLVALTITWGLNWPMMKLALLEVPPWTFRSLCLMIGGGALLALARTSGAPMAVPMRLLPALALVSLFNITGWHLFSAYALLYTGSGRAAIIGYTMPLWASLLGLWVLHTRPTQRQVAALLLGMAALVLLIVKDFGALGAAPLGALLMLGASLCWAIGTVLVKRFAWDPLGVMALTAWQQLIGGAPIVLGWWLLEPVPDLTALSVPAALGLAYAIFVAMIFCQTAFFKLLSLLPAHVAAISVLPVPVVGVISSALILNESVSLAEIVALTLVVGGLFLLVRPAGR